MFALRRQVIIAGFGAGIDMHELLGHLSRLHQTNKASWTNVLKQVRAHLRSAEAALVTEALRRSPAYSGL